MRGAGSGRDMFPQTASETDPGQLEDFNCAMERARATDRPVFLYWGTKWCPPCAEVQVTVLQRPQFAERCTRMLALTIDGDAPGAQAFGERVDVEVYPSMLVLGADGRE